MHDKAQSISKTFGVPSADIALSILDFEARMNQNPFKVDD
jgi:hypothetical protein